MPVTPKKSKAPTRFFAKVSFATSRTFAMTTTITAWIMMIMLMMLGTNLVRATATASSDFDEFLRTESTIIDTLQRYIVNLEGKISVIKSKTAEIQSVHNTALNDVDKYVSNPLNALTILKRFATDWNALEQMAGNVLNNTNEISKDINAVTASLKFPNDDDFDEAVGNLLRLQDIYKIEPKRLSLGEVNGIKFGSEMTWSDCLEIGRKSSDNGDYLLAKFWMETAMEKLPAIDAQLPHTNSNSDANTNTTDAASNEAENSEISKARFDILQALLNTEFHVGNFETALNITNKMLELRPEHKGVVKAKTTIEKKLLKETKRAKSKRMKKTQKIQEGNQKRETKLSAEAAFIAEICRESTIAPHKSNAASNANICRLESGNSFELLLQPVKIELFSSDPYIAIEHDALTQKQTEDLRNLIDGANIENDSDAEDDEENGHVAASELKFTELAERKLERINEKLQRSTGHSSILFAKWQPQERSFENEASLSNVELSINIPTLAQQRTATNMLLNLQTAKLGGAVVFPQLELSLQVPSGALLYWSNLNEFHEVDYRSRHYICPVIAGTQITAVTTVQRA